MKKLISLLFISICCLFGLTACNQPSSVYGSFKNENYVLNVGETIDFQNELSLKGLDFQKIEINFSNNNVLTKEGDLWSASESGETIVFANYEQITIAQCKIVVNYKFSSPSNVKISQDGILEWEVSAINKNSGFVKAQQYIVKIGQTKEYQVLTNSFDFKAEGLSYGNYQIQIAAVGIEEENILSSDFSNEFTVIYDYVSMVKGLDISVSQTFLDQTAQLSWVQTENVVYDIYFNGFKVNQEKLTEANFSYNFSKFADGSLINVDIIGFDVNQEKLSTTVSYQIEKLFSVATVYKFYEDDGFLLIDDNQNALGYILYWSQIAGDVVGQKIVQSGKKEFLDELENGIYNISVQALGGENNGSLYLSSNNSQSITFAKLSTPEPVVNVNESGVEIVFNEDFDSYVSKFKITIGNYSKVYDIAEGLNLNIDSSYLKQGENELKIYALPTADENSSTGVKYYIVQENMTNRVLSSSPFTKNIYLLSDIGDISHTLTEENTSHISFKNVLFANSFKLYVNEQEVPNFDFQIGSINTTISFEGLNTYQPTPEGEFIIRVEALRTDGTSINSYGEKTLRILSAPTKANSENGQFSWNAVEGDVLYKYEIFSVDENGENESLYLSDSTQNLFLNQELPFGYYKIRIISSSLDENLYLNSNFKDESNVLEENFLVYQQIESPTVEFVEENGVYKIKISSEEYAGHFCIMLDGAEIDSFDVVENQDSYVRTLSGQTFAEEKQYLLTVVASAGEMYDKNLHTDSIPTEIKIIRISTPTYSVEEIYSQTGLFGIDGEIGKKIEENLVVSSGADEAYVDHYEIAVNGIKENLDNQNKINMIDQPSSFEISFYAVAKQSEENVYYLDSKKETKVVNRLSQPSNLSFSKERVSVVNSDQSITEKYFVEIELFVESGNRTINFFVEKNSFNLQDKIDQFLENSVFSNEFAQASKIGIKVYSYISPKEINGELTLQSLNAVTSNLETQLIINKMEATILSFDAETQTLKWNRVGEQTKYDVYNGENLVLEDYTNNSISLDSVLLDVDLTTQNATFRVVAKNDSYLNSSSSNQIEVAKLSSASKMQIVCQNGSWQAVLNIAKSSDARRISKIYVNDEKIDYTKGQMSAVIDLSKYEQPNFNLEIKLIASNSVDESIYYLNSDTGTFKLTNISQNSLNANVENNKIIWTSPYLSWQEALGLVSYVIVIEDGQSQYIIDNYTETEISIAEIEKLAKVSFDDGAQLTISIESILNSFELTSLLEGRFGVVKQTGISLGKVEAIESGEVNISLAETEDLILQQTKSKVEISFANIWDENVSFNVLINSDVSFENLNLSSPFEDCSLSLSEGYYKIAISSSLISLAGSNNIAIRVNGQNVISSNWKDFSITRNNDVIFASLSEEGVLDVNYGKNCKDTLIVKAIVGDQLSYQKYSTSISQIDLSEFLKDKSGGVEIQLIVADSENMKLSSMNIYSLSQIKLPAIESIIVKNDGQVSFTISSNSFEEGSSNIEFIAQNEQGEIFIFEPVQTDNLFVYTYSLQDFIKLLGINQQGSYNIKVANRVKNALNSDFVDFVINYKIEEENNVIKIRSSQTSDYILFKLLATEGNLATCGFRFTITNNLNEVVYQKLIDLSDSATNFKGYWDNNTNKFNTAKPSGENYFECFGFSINELFESLEYGNFTLEVCRIASQENSYYIFSSNQFNIMKLNNVVEDSYNPLSIAIEGNILKWTWVKPDDSSLPSNFVPSAYMISYWPTNSPAQVKTIITTNNTLDLREVPLADGYNTLTIQAISENENILSSSVLKTSLTPFKYSQTKPVTLENGKIVFNLNKDGAIDKTIDFVKVFDTETSTNIANNLAQIGENGFYDIYYFQTNFVADQTIKLKFVETDSSGSSVSGKTYYATVNALDLMPNFIVSNTNFLTQLKDYIDLHSGSLEINYQNLVAFYEKVKDMAQGITDGEILFDDFGNSIPAGYYNVSAIQTTTNIFDDFIDSEASASKLIYVSSAPSSQLLSEYNEQTGEETYKAQFNLTNIVGDDGILTKATSYIMLLREVNDYGQSNAYRFEIKYSSSWAITYNTSQIYNVISGDENSFVINYSALAEHQLEENYLIDKNKQYIVYVYAVGNNYSCFGKSSNMSLTFLNLESSNLSIENGFFTITTSKNEVGSDILVKYRRKYGSGSEVQEQIIKMETNEQGQVILNNILTNSGLYDYIIFNVMGQIDDENMVMKLPSVSYGILNAYKLYSPLLSTSQNKLLISAQSNDSQYGPFKYELTNGETIIYSDTEFYNTESENISSMFVDHSKVNINGENAVRFITGSTFNISIVDNLSEGQSYPYFEKKIDLDKIVLSSELETISLQGLEKLTEISIREGNITWIEFDAQGLTFDENVEIVYKIQVDYYDRVGYKGTQDFWTQQTVLDSSLIENNYTQGVGAYFNISIYVYVGKSSDIGGNELIEGGYIDISDSFAFSDGAQILHSQAITLEEVYKASTPKFADENQVYEGKIAILKDQERQFAINLIKSNGQIYNLIKDVDFIVEEGKIILSDNSSVDVYFISIVNEQFANKENFTLDIYAYSDSEIKSSKLSTKSLYKFATPALSQLSLSLQQNQFGEYENILSLEKYFNDNQFAYANNMYEIVLLNALNQEVYVFDNTNKTFKADDLEQGSYSLIVRPKTNENSYLTSEQLNIGINLFDESNELIFLFNENDSRFEWSYSNNLNYKFFAKVTYDDNETESFYIKDYLEKAGTRYYYLQPSKMGNIKEISLFASKDLQEGEIVLYSKIGSWEGEWQFDLFESGKGTQYDPYVIQNAEQFANIGLRDDANNQVYFSLGQSISLTLEETNKYLLENFYGQLEGNGNTISVAISSSQIQNPSINYSLNMGSSSNRVTFTNAQSIIKTIQQNAIVKNVKIDLSFDYSALGDYLPTIISGLATENYGVIQSCEINISSLNLSKNLTSLAVAGLVGVNYGTIQDCSNYSNLQTNYPTTAINLFYGGIALLNQSGGLIIGCQNNGAIELTIRKENSGIYLGGIVCENNGGQIRACGNNADITILGDYQFESAVAGVVSRNIGQASYIFNNGQILSSSGSAGIIYYYRSGNIGELFEFSGINAIGAIYGSSISQTGKIYAYKNTIAGITVTELPGSLSGGEEFLYNQNYKLVVQKEQESIVMLLEKL